MNRSELIRRLEELSKMINSGTCSMDEYVKYKVDTLRAQELLRALPPDSRIDVMVHHLVSGGKSESQLRSYLERLPESTLQNLYVLLMKSPDASGPAVVSEIISRYASYDGFKD